jgi:transposase
MRRGINGLAAQVQQQFRLDPRQQAVFLFCGKRSDRFKALFWDGDGFVLLYKRLENGKYKWPRDSDEARQITPQEFRWLMEGLSIEQKTAIRPAKTGAVC